MRAIDIPENDVILIMSPSNHANDDNVLQSQPTHDEQAMTNDASLADPKGSSISLSNSSHDENGNVTQIPVTPPPHQDDESSKVPCDDDDDDKAGPVSLVDIDHGLYCVEIVPPEPVPTSRLCSNIKEPLQIGDHVYQWRSWLGIPGIFQHHGIIMDIQYETSQDDSPTTTTMIAKLTIADFSNVEQSVRSKRVPLPDSIQKERKRRSGLTQEGILRTYTDTDRWHKVEYQAPWWKRSVYRAGTCTSVASDAVGLVLARVNYILRNPEVLPDYHVVNANCECVAVWCKTGRWSTLQASSLLELTAAGQVKSSATLAATAASTQVTVQTPAAGLWGWLGYTTSTQVSWLSLHPLFIPALAGYAVLSVGVPAILYVNARKQWKQTTEQLKELFWEDALAHPEVFAECISHWSNK